MNDSFNGAGATPGERVAEAVAAEARRDVDVREFAGTAREAMEHLLEHSEWEIVPDLTDTASCALAADYVSFGTRFGAPGGSRSDYLAHAAWAAASKLGLRIVSVDEEASQLLLSEVAEGALDPVGYLDDMRRSGVLDLIGDRSADASRTPVRAR